MTTNPEAQWKEIYVSEKKNYETTLTIKCKICEKPSLRTFRFINYHDMQRYLATEYSKIDGEKIYNSYCIDHMHTNCI